jgi:hypothetical protein
LAEGFTSSRGTGGSDTSNAGFRNGVNVQNFAGWALAGIHGKSQAQITSYVNEVVEYCAYYGHSIVCFGHAGENTTAAEFGYLLDAFIAADAILSTQSQISTFIRSKTLKPGTTFYYQDPPAATPDFSLLSTSPCINAGTDVGLTEDYEGNRVPRGRAPDIGAYEYPVRAKAVLFMYLLRKR